MIGYIRLPNGVILQTVDGVIDTIYTGAAGAIDYYVPKFTAIDISESGISGNITTNGTDDVIANDCILLTSINAPLARYVNGGYCTLLTEINAPLANQITAINSSLTAKTIGDILHSAYVANKHYVYFNFISGSNANATAINAYLLATYGVTFTTVKNALVALGGTILNNA